MLSADSSLLTQSRMLAQEIFHMPIQQIVVLIFTGCRLGPAVLLRCMLLAVKTLVFVAAGPLFVSNLLLLRHLCLPVQICAPLVL
jgi:hypothetical protein